MKQHSRECKFIWREWQPLVKLEASGGQHPEDIHRVLNGIFLGDYPFRHHHLT